MGGLNRELLKHTSIYSAATILGKAVGFLFLPVYASYFSTSGFGALGMLEGATDLLFVLFSYTITSSVSRFYFDKSLNEPKAVISTALWVALVALVTILPLVVLFGRPLSSLLLGDTSYYWVLVFSFAGLLAEITAQVGATHAMITNRSLLFSVVSTAKLLLGIALNVVLVIVLEVGVIGVILSGLICSVLSSIVFNVIAVRDCGGRFDMTVLRRMAEFGLPLVPGNLISYLSRQVERFIVRFAGGLDVVGILEMGYKWAPLLNLLVVHPFFQYWNPKRLDLAEHTDDAPEVLGSMVTKFAVVMMFCALVLAVNVREIIQILTPEQFWPSHTVATVEILTVVLNAFFTHLHFGLFFRKKTGEYSFIISSVSIAKIAVSFLFIQLWGIKGAALSACLAAAVQLVWATIASQRLYRLVLEYRKLVLIGGISLLLYLVSELPLVRMLAGLAPVFDVAPPRILEQIPLVAKGWVTLVERQSFAVEAGVSTAIALLYVPLVLWLIPSTRPAGRAVVTWVKGRLRRAWPEL